MPAPKFQLEVSPASSRPASPSNVTAVAVETSLPAGCQDAQVYKSMMPLITYRIRCKFIASLERELPVLVKVQSTLRHRYLDTYFHLASLLGTHSSFLVCLPLFFWFGLPKIGFDLLFILGVGIASTSILKDLFCVPRPYSPPVDRFRLVGSHAKEYGWPSTHSTNAVNVALVCAATVGPLGKCLLAIYAASVVFGRIYSGMHSMMDCASGVVIAFLQHLLLVPLTPALVSLCQSGHPSVGPLVLACVLLFITFHPQPIDPCPCFEDTVAIVSVVQGCLLGHWALGFVGSTWVPASGYQLDYTSPAAIGLCAAKIAIGISILILWRLVAKQILHHTLPTLIRISKPYLALPRRYYEPSNSYAESYLRTEPTDNILLHPVPSLLDLSNPLEGSVARSSDSSNAPESQLRARKQGSNGKAAVDAAKLPPDAGKPPQRYDADVLTKIVVYSGIGLLACFGIPFAFEWVDGRMQ